MARYTRLTRSEREELSLRLSWGWRYRQIARELDRSPSTLCREVRRNGVSVWHYRASCAQGKAARRRRYCCRRRLDESVRLRRWVFRRLRRCWSPEQIARRLPLVFARDGRMRLSHEALYTYLYVLPRGALRRELLSYLAPAPPAPSPAGPRRRSARPDSRPDQHRGTSGRGGPAHDTRPLGE